MISYLLIFRKNPYDAHTGIPQWWPSYIREKRISHNPGEYYKLKLVLPNQYKDEFVNYIKENIEKFLISWCENSV